MTDIPSPQPAPAYSREHHVALREAHHLDCEESYFGARPEMVTEQHRKLFAAGYGRGFDAGVGVATPAITATEGAQAAEIQPLPQAEFDALMDHIYEHGTMAEGITARARAMCQAYARAALATQAQAAPAATVEDNSQQWAGMDGTTAWHLIERHAGAGRQLPYEAGQRCGRAHGERRGQRERRRTFGGHRRLRAQDHAQEAGQAGAGAVIQAPIAGHRHDH